MQPCESSAPAGIGVVNEIFIFLKKREITATIMTTSELDKRFSFFRQPKKSGGEQMNQPAQRASFFFFILVCICYFFVLFFFSFCMCYWFLFHQRCYFGVCVFCETEILVISLFSIFCRHFVSYRLINTCNVTLMNNESTNRHGSLTYLKTLSVLSC